GGSAFFVRQHRMRRWIPILFGAVGAVMVGYWTGLFEDLRQMPRWADILLAAPVTRIASFVGQVFFHGRADADGLFGPVAMLYCVSIGALVGFGISFLFPKRS